MTYSTLNAFLGDQIGRFVAIDGQEFMFVGCRGSWAVFENEDERTVQKRLPVAALLLGASRTEIARWLGE